MTQRARDRARVRYCLTLAAATVLCALLLWRMTIAAADLSLPTWLFAVLPVLYLAVPAGVVAMAVLSLREDRRAEQARAAQQEQEQEAAARQATRPARNVVPFARRGDGVVIRFPDRKDGAS